MTAAQVEKLFSPGTKPTSRLGTASEPGTGLGLVLCAELVQRNSGTLTVTSEVGRGSVFVVTLPRPATPPAGR
jgi:signal transduction histidine kinase